MFPVGSLANGVQSCFALERYAFLIGFPIKISKPEILN